MTPPPFPHTALFIYSESFAQSEDGRRFHVFARLEDEASPQRTVIFYTRDLPDQSETVWHQHALPDSLVTQIEDTFGSLTIPLQPGVRATNDLDYHRSLELQIPGATYYLGWDTGDSALADSLAPLLTLLLPLVNEMKAALEASELAAGS